MDVKGSSRDHHCQLRTLILKTAFPFLPFGLQTWLIPQIAALVEERCAVIFLRDWIDGL